MIKNLVNDDLVAQRERIRLARGRRGRQQKLTRAVGMASRGQDFYDRGADHLRLVFVVEKDARVGQYIEANLCFRQHDKRPGRNRNAAERMRVAGGRFDDEPVQVDRLVAVVEQFKPKVVVAGAGRRGLVDRQRNRLKGHRLDRRSDRRQLGRE